ncbi:unnamed protein product [Amoebophrya sp. A25]|nr:unnamed protein product [Amoebophrya sp. A25]|eukprot:GSA25T00022728001.1
MERVAYYDSHFFPSGRRSDDEGPEEDERTHNSGNSDLRDEGRQHSPITRRAANNDTTTILAGATATRDRIASDASAGSRLLASNQHGRGMNPPPVVPSPTRGGISSRETTNQDRAGDLPSSTTDRSVDGSRTATNRASIEDWSTTPSIYDGSTNYVTVNQQERNRGQLPKVRPVVVHLHRRTGILTTDEKSGKLHRERRSAEESSPSRNVRRCRAVLGQHEPCRARNKSFYF